MGRFFQVLGISNDIQLKTFSKSSGVSVSRLKYYNVSGVFPSGNDLQNITKATGLNETELRLRLGVLNNLLLEAISQNATEIHRLVGDIQDNCLVNPDYAQVFSTPYGTMFQGDCLSLMETMEKESIDLIFADPPFNLNKAYESGINDLRDEGEYLAWTERWVLKCVDLLKDGGSIFIWNLPKWNSYISSILNQYLTFRHWIAVDIKFSLPIKNKLYPSHYSLLYYVKGEKPKAFNEQRIPLENCRHCGGDIRDYGGYKDKLNINGINLTDVWYDIPPVRHSKYKNRDSNELSLKLLERVISIASNEGDLVFDPFGGSGTTYIVAEILKRKWVGIEIGDVSLIQKRFEDIDTQREFILDIQKNKNTLFTSETRKKRIKNGHWLPETLKKVSKDGQLEIHWK
ncbi:MAG: DNA methyltransferase [Bacteroidota bacterium]